MSDPLKPLEDAAGVVKQDVSKVEADVKSDLPAAYVVAACILALGVAIGQALFGIFGI